jgi:hypothetical protein
MQLFAGLEADGFAWSDRHFSACSRIAADTSLPWLYGEDAEAAQLNAVARDKRLLHAVEDSVYRRLCFGSWQAGTLNNPLYKILLNHLGRRPWAVILENWY